MCDELAWYLDEICCGANPAPTVLLAEDGDPPEWIRISDGIYSVVCLETSLLRVIHDIPEGAYVGTPPDDVPVGSVWRHILNAAIFAGDRR